jgi:hypothetical protein
MGDIINLSVEVALTSDLTPVELGIYVRCKGLLQRGRKAFSIADFSQLDGKELFGSAMDRLLSLGYVVHRGGGWFSLAKKPVKDSRNKSVEELVVERSVRTAGQGGSVAKKSLTSQVKERSRKDGRYEQLETILTSKVIEVFGYKPSSMLYSTNDRANKVCYRKIFLAIDKGKSSIDEFVWFIYQNDWGFLNLTAPNIRLLSSNNFLGSYESYLQNKDKLKGLDDIFVAYDNAFGVHTARGLPEMQVALKLKTTLRGASISPPQFFSYAASIRWSSFKGAPPLSFLASDKFFKQSQLSMHTGNGASQEQIGIRNFYLGRILDRLRKVPRNTSDEEFEDYNWQVAETVFEPLKSIVSKNGADPQLVKLVIRAVDEKHLPTFGSYVVTKGGKFTPLAVYWISYAAKYLGDSFCPPGIGSWKEVMKDFAAREVDLRVLEL